MKQSLRHKIADLIFQQEYGKPVPRIDHVSFDKAKTIGILYDSTNEKYFEIVKRYVKEIRERHHKDVLSLGFYDDKILPPMRFSKLGMDFFTRKDLNWYFKPVTPVVRNFVSRKFDILIDLHTGNNFPFRYIVAMSQANFKIGKYDRASERQYDFMISNAGQISVPQFIDQVNMYFRLFKHETAI